MRGDPWWTRGGMLRFLLWLSIYAIYAWVQMKLEQLGSP